MICGSPIYEYDHMLEWCKTHHHKADELTLLCSKHHTEKTKGLLPVEKVKAANRNPYNFVHGESSPQTLYYDGNHFKLKLGDSVSTYTDLRQGQTFSPFAIDGLPVVAFFNDYGNILLNIEFRDASGEVIFRVTDSELVYSVGVWDVEWVGQTLTIREGLGRISLELEFAPPSMVSINRGSLHFNGIEIEVGPDFVFCLNNQSFIIGCAVHDTGYGFALGDPAPSGPCGIVFSGIPRPVCDRDAAKRYMKQTLKEMREKREHGERRLKGELHPLSTFGKLMLSSATICYSVMGV